MELRELRLIVSRYLPIAFVVFVLCVAIGAAAAFVPAKTYRTSATIVLDVNNDPEFGGGSVQQASFLLPAIEEKAKSLSLRDRVADDVSESSRPVRVRIETVSDASVLRIRGTSEDPVAAAEWVNAISNRLIEEQAESGPVELGLLDSAPVKPKPIAPNTEPIILAAIVVGLIAALFSTLAADRIKQAFDNNQAIRERLGTTVLGEIPVLRRRSERSRSIVSLLADGSGSRELTSAFETISTNVKFRMAQVRTERVAVVSLHRNSGKSTITGGLCYTLASIGHHVVAIDADLRQPNLDDQMNVVPRKGLGDLTAFGPDPMTDWNEFSETVNTSMVQDTKHPRLKLLSAGIPIGRAADVVTTTLPSVLNALSDGNRWLFVDCPPLQGAPESAIVVSEAHHIVLVANHNSSDYANLTDAIDRITDAGGSLLGVVINRVPRRRIRKQKYPEYRNRSTKWVLPEPEVEATTDETESSDVGSSAISETR